MNKTKRRFIELSEKKYDKQTDDFPTNDYNKRKDLTKAEKIERKILKKVLA